MKGVSHSLNIRYNIIQGSHRYYDIGPRRGNKGLKDMIRDKISETIKISVNLL